VVKRKAFRNQRAVSPVGLKVERKIPLVHLQVGLSRISRPPYRRLWEKARCFASTFPRAELVRMIWTPFTTILTSESISGTPKFTKRRSIAKLLRAY
jgi:hypothetical protein